MLIEYLSVSVSPARQFQLRYSYGLFGVRRPSLYLHKDENLRTADGNLQLFISHILLFANNSLVYRVDIG